MKGAASQTSIFPDKPEERDKTGRAQTRYKTHPSRSSGLKIKDGSSSPPSWFQVGTLPSLLLFDAAVMVTFWVASGDGFLFSYDAPGSVIWDLCIVGLLRILLLLGVAIAFDAFALSPQRRRVRRPVKTDSFLTRATGAGVSPSNTAHFTTTSVARELSLREEANSATQPSPIRRMERVGRSATLVLTLMSYFILMAKCLMRLLMGIGFSDSMACFWGCVAASAILGCVDYIVLKRHLRYVKRWAYQRHREALVRKKGTLRESLLLSTVSGNGSVCLGSEGPEGEDAERTAGGEELEDESEEEREDLKEAAHLSEVWASLRGLDDAEAAEDATRGRGGKDKGHATYKDLLSLTRDDWHLISSAFAFLLGAAIGQVLIPHYTGKAIDAIVSEEGAAAFQHAMVMLVLCAAVCGACTGLRGAIFTIVGARVNRRIRDMLFQSLIRQEVGFFDTAKTGDLSSRLSSDCTKVGDQVSLNINFFLRSLVQAVGTLIFMFIQSWKLSLVAFVSVPVIVIMSKVSRQGREEAVF